MDTSFGENMVVIYLAIFGCFGIVKLFMDLMNLEINNKIYWGFVTVAFFIYLLTWNVLLVTHKIACDDPNGYVAIYSTIIPFTFIFILGGTIINLFPGWLRSFQNTFGLTFVQLCGFTLYDENDKSNSIIERVDNNDTDTVKKFFNDPDKLINEFTIDSNSEENINKIDNILSSIGCRLNNNKGYDLLVKYIKIKETVGYAIWFLLLGLLTILTSQNTILSEECNKSVSDDKTFKKYISSELRE
jgi:hypothetical protein